MFKFTSKAISKDIYAFNKSLLKLKPIFCSTVQNKSSINAL